jgi:hypothetical protein
MSRKTVRLFCDNDMREYNDLEAGEANLKDRDMLW